MNRERIARCVRTGIIWISLLFVAEAALAEEDARTRINETRQRIKERIEECREQERAGREPMVAELRAELKSLAVDAAGLVALARYQNHRIEFVALLAVEAIASAPVELQLVAGRILATRVSPRTCTEKRMTVFLQTVRALGRTGYLGGVQPLLRTLPRTRDPEACQAMIEALGRLGDPCAVAILQDRLSTGASANLRGPEGGSQARRRSQNPRQATGVNGKKNNVATNARGECIETLPGDVQPSDEKAVVNEIYNTLSKLLGQDFTSWHAVDQYRRTHKKELKKACSDAEKRRKEQERKASRLLR